MSRLANHRPTSGERNQLAKTRYGAIHEDNPAGSKLARRFAKVILRKRKEPTKSRDLSYSRAFVVIKQHERNGR